MTASALAEAVVAAVERDRAIVVEPARARATWRVLRTFPALALRVQQRAVQRERAST